jgi:NAD(P)-dependent dehydrogenase (short-subunit alcohol dehydrogenase family)
MDTHYFGTLSVIRAFAPVLGRHESSVVLNVLSVVSRVSFADFGAYCAAKSAGWAMSNALRQELAPQGTGVSTLHVGFMDTDMTSTLEVPRADRARRSGRRRLRDRRRRDEPVRSGQPEPGRCALFPAPDLLERDVTAASDQAAPSSRPPAPRTDAVG